MKKSILSVLLVMVILSVVMQSDILASERTVNTNDEINGCKKRAEIFLENIGYDLTLTNPQILKNLSDENEAIIFKLENKGYIIVNIKDYSIPELNFEGENPFKNVENAIYNGPFEYYYKSGSEIRSIYDDRIVKSSLIDNVYKRDKILDKTEYLEELSLEYQMKNVRTVSNQKNLKGSLQTWYISGGNCGSIATAICMRYYYDYISGIYVNSKNISQNSLIKVMQGYVGEGATTYKNMVNGLNSYFRDQNVYNSALQTNTFSFSKVKQAIIDNKPIIIGTYRHPKFGNHWLIAHGYYENSVDGNYIIVNNGWGNNNVWVETDSATLDGTIYFSR